MNILTTIGRKIEESKPDDAAFELVEAWNQAWFDAVEAKGGDAELKTLSPFRYCSDGVTWAIEFMDSTLVDSENLVFDDNNDDETETMRITRNVVNEFQKMQSIIGQLLAD